MLFCSHFAAADEVSGALRETQNILRDPVRLQNEALTTPGAQAADRNASAVTLGKPELKQDLMGISADLMTWIVDSAQGDPDKMQMLVTEAMDSPAAFLQRMPSAERQKIKNLSEKIESSKIKNQYP